VAEIQGGQAAGFSLGGEDSTSLVAFEKVKPHQDRQHDRSILLNGFDSQQPRLHADKTLEHSQKDMLLGVDPVATLGVDPVAQQATRWLPCALIFEHQGDDSPFNGFIAPLRLPQNVSPAQLTTDALSPMMDSFSVVGSAPVAGQPSRGRSVVAFVTCVLVVLLGSLSDPIF
jgi:hypothetical protein